MSALEDDTLEETATEKPAPAEKPARRRGRKPGSVSVSRLDKRAAKVAQTIREATGWRLGSRKEDLGFVATIDRDADRIGHAVAAIAERFKPAGMLIDLLFGEAGPLSILVALAPTIRAGRRSMLERAERRAAEREAAADEQEAQADIPAGVEDWPPADVGGS